MSKTYTKKDKIDNFEIKYKKHPFSKSIKITLKDENSILVTMPYSCPYKTAQNFLMSNFEKIKNFKINKKTIKPDFKTKFDTLKIEKSDELKIKTKKSIVYFCYPDNLDFDSDVVQKTFKEAILKAVKIEANFYLPDRLNFLAQKYGFKYNEVRLRNQKTRFGSCSFYNNINLNINLMNYDFDVIDYVLIHELCHTKVKNHSSRFWNEVEKICPNYKILRNKLKNSNVLQ